MNKPSKEFITWLNFLDKKNSKLIEKTYIDGMEGDPYKALNDLTKKTRNYIIQGSTLNININFASTGYKIDSNYLVFDKKVSNSTNINTITLSITANQIDKLAGLNIRELKITDWSIVKNYFLIENCWIDTLVVDDNCKANLDIKNCSIGRLELRQHAFNNLRVTDSQILALSCPPPDANNPFFGQVYIGSDVYFPKKENEYKGEIYSHQYYSNARNHLMKLHNVAASSILHSTELRLEKKNLPVSTKFFSFFYSLFSDYGNSIIRPIVWLFFFSLLSFLIFLPEKHLHLNENIKPPPWISEKSVADCHYVEIRKNFSYDLCIERAFWVTFEPVFNPLGAITGDETFQPTSVPLMVFHTIQRLLLIIFLFFTLLALRRKFRLTN